MKNLLKIFLAIAAFFAGGFSLVPACGPFFSNSVLESGDGFLFIPPLANFKNEIRQIPPPIQLKLNQGAPGTKEADLADLQIVIAKSNFSQEETNKIIADYSSVRAYIEKYQAALSELESDDEREEQGRDSYQTIKNKPKFQPPPIPEKLPAEFKEYSTGALQYHQDKLDEAKQTWKKLLERPEAERKYRSVWAAFMLGKANAQTHPDEACKWFRRTRDLAEQGFVDSAGLALESLGEEARVLYKNKKFAPAMELYLTQFHAGKDSAWVSLMLVANNLFEDNKTFLAEMAKTTITRRVCSAFIVSDGRYNSDYQVQGAGERWLSALEDAKIRDVEDSDRIAWAAYFSGDFKSVARWLKIAPKESTVTKWIKSKMFLRDGKLEEAAQCLSSAIQNLPLAKGVFQQHYWYKEWCPVNDDDGDFDTGGDMLDSSFLAVQTRGELGSIRLSQQKYIEALDIFLQAGYWADAAYVAERVLTPDELKKYVDAKYPKVLQKDVPAGQSNYSAELRHLLARRLARVGRLKESRSYFPEKYRPIIEEYNKALTD